MAGLRALSMFDVQAVDCLGWCSSFLAIPTVSRQFLFRLADWIDISTFLKFTVEYILELTLEVASCRCSSSEFTTPQNSQQIDKSSHQAEDNLTHSIFYKPHRKSMRKLLPQEPGQELATDGSLKILGP